MDNLIKKSKAVLSDIENMQFLASTPDGDSDHWFGKFSEFRTDGETVEIEWPNLAISAGELKDALAEFEVSK